MSGIKDDILLRLSDDLAILASDFCSVEYKKVRRGILFWRHYRYQTWVYCKNSKFLIGDYYSAISAISDRNRIINLVTNATKGIQPDKGLLILDYQ